jgi:hypothetical protein
MGSHPKAGYPKGEQPLPSRTKKAYAKFGSVSQNLHQI